MPAKSQAQRGLVFSKRDQYGSKKKTPKKWKWVWDKDWENKGKLPKRKKKKARMSETLVSESVDEFIDVDDDEGPDVISTYGPHDTPVGEEPTEINPVNPRRYNRKFKQEERIQNREQLIQKFKAWLKKKSFMNEVYYADTQETDVLFDKIMDELMKRSYTWQEADFAIDQVSDKMEQWGIKGAEVEEIADYIDEKVFGIK